MDIQGPRLEVDGGVGACNRSRSEVARVQLLTRRTPCGQLGDLTWRWACQGWLLCGRPLLGEACALPSSITSMAEISPLTTRKLATQCLDTSTR